MLSVLFFRHELLELWDVVLSRCKYSGPCVVTYLLGIRELDLAQPAWTGARQYARSTEG